MQVLDPIHIASSEGRVDVVRYLLEHAVPVDCASAPPQSHLTETGGYVRAAPKTACDETPLQLACRKGHVDVVRLLHAHGADLGAKLFFRGATPFSLAFRAGHSAVVSYLRQHGVREHLGSGRISASAEPFEAERSLPAPKKPRKAQRTTPMRTRAERANVLDRYKDTPPNLRERASEGSQSAKNQLRAIRKHDHQVVDRAEIAAHPDQARHAERKSCGAKQKRTRRLKSQLDNALDDSCALDDTGVFS